MRRAIASFMAVILGAAYGRADVLIYKDGMEEKCKVIEEKECCYIVGNANGERAIKKSKVESVSRDERGIVLVLQEKYVRTHQEGSFLLGCGVGVLGAFGLLLLWLAQHPITS